MPTVITQGAASAKGYGFGARATAANYIEDVFSTYLYTGNGSTQTITNGIDLSGKGGLVWVKDRTIGFNHVLYDTVRGASNALQSDNTGVQSAIGGVTAFNANGFTSNSSVYTNYNSTSYASWTFRKQAKFFDVVTYTGNGTTNRTISHNLGSVPGCIIIKNYGTSGTDWIVYHRSLSTGGFGPYSIYLNLTNAQNASDEWGSAPTSSVFTVNNNNVNANGATYVAYLFAHDAGGFGLTGSDNVISCGSFTTGGSGNATVTLGYEPQWLLVKVSSGTTGDWRLIDNMRGFSLSSEAFLRPNSSASETVLSTPFYTPTSTGFNLTGSSPSITFIYIAIRRGPMKPPTSGTSVYNASTWGGGTSGYTVTGAGFPPDTVLLGWQTSLGGNSQTWFDRLRGTSPALYTAFTVAEDSTYPISSFDQNGFKYSGSNWTAAGYNRVQWMFRRAPGFFDVVCYTGTGANRTVSHNLGVAPELMIVKRRDNTNNWTVYASALGATQWIPLNLTNAASAASIIWNDTSPSLTAFTVGTSFNVNGSGSPYVAYLFATVAGVSKVGSYTGTGTTKQIDCGFTSGARFVLIKRTDSTGDWYVWDSARGIVAGNDPYLLLNSTAAEVTSTDYVDTYSAGFEISSTAPAAINANGGSFIFLAIA